MRRHDAEKIRPYDGGMMGRSVSVECVCSCRSTDDWRPADGDQTIVMSTTTMLQSHRREIHIRVPKNLHEFWASGVSCSGSSVLGFFLVPCRRPRTASPMISYPGQFYQNFIVSFLHRGNTNLMVCGCVWYPHVGSRTRCVATWDSCHETNGL